MALFQREKAVNHIFQKYIYGDGNIDELDDMIDFLLYHKLDMVYFSLREKSKKNCCDFLKKRKERICYVNQINLDEINRITHKLEQLGLHYVILKGVAALIDSYHNLNDRYFWDVDFLVLEEELSSVEKMFLSDGYIYGEVRNGKVVDAKREEIIFQRYYTHELYNLVKLNEDVHVDIDINFKFSWSGISESKIEQIKFKDVQNYIVKYPYKDYEYNIFEVNMQFVHLCCHFYNEAFYFALDPGFKGGDPKELRLFRLLDICLLLDKIDSLEVFEIANKFDCVQRINFVIKIIEMVMGEKYVKKYFPWEYDVEHFNCYIGKNQEWNEWSISMEERLFDLDKRYEACSNLFPKE